jgi:uroporphyrinogen-III decarboxylase
MYDCVKVADLLKEKVAGERIVEGRIEGPCGMAHILRGINTLMFDSFDDPVFVRDLLDFVVEMELRFANDQMEA